MMKKTLIRLSIAVVIISIIFIIKLHKSQIAPRPSLDNKKSIKLPSKDNPYVKSIPKELEEAKDHLPELKQTFMAMNDNFINSMNMFSQKEKQWWKEYRDIMLMNLEHVDENQTSVKTYTIENRQPDFEEMKKVFPGLTEEG